jgi:deoxyribose-phosphate aldolase
MVPPGPGREMTSVAPGLLDRVEGVLLNPTLTAADAIARAEAWTGLGVRRILAAPWLLDRLAAEELEGVALAGAVAYPHGGATLTSKRVELLECVKLGAKAATVVLTPGLVSSADASALEREMAPLLATAPELEVRFLVDAEAHAEAALTVLMRVLKSVQPAFLVLARGLHGGSTGPARLKWMRDHLTTKVKLASLGTFAGVAEARAAVSAGAALLCADRPELLVEAAP